MMAVSVVSRVLMCLLMLTALPAVTPVQGAGNDAPSLNRGWAGSVLAPRSATAQYQFVAVVAGGPGLVTFGVRDTMGGRSPGRGRLALWTSLDGRTWTAVKLDSKIFAGSFWNPSIGSGAKGIVISAQSQVGNSGHPLQQVFWRSTDAVHWSRVNYPQPKKRNAVLQIFTVTAGATGFIAVGSTNGMVRQKNRTLHSQQDAVVLFSPNGATWRDVSHGNTIFRSVFLTTATARGPGFVIAGNQQSILSTGARALVYSSRDGVTWSTPARIPLAPGNHEQFINRIVANSTRLVAVGGESGYRGGVKVWASHDASHWRSSSYTYQGGSGLPNLAAFDGGFVGIGSQEGFPELWLSSDGLRWRTAQAESTFGSPRTGTVQLQGVSGFRDGLVVVGTVESALAFGGCGAPGRGARWSQPKVWAWTPAAAAGAPSPLRADPNDPHAFALRLADLPKGTSVQLPVGYWDICTLPVNGGRLSPGPFPKVLGRYTAYRSWFLVPHAAPPTSMTNVTSFTIVTGTVATAQTAMNRAAVYFSPAYGFPKKSHVIQTLTGIGNEAQLWDTHQFADVGEDSPPKPTPARAVIWRSGRAIGIVVVYRSGTAATDARTAMQYARMQFQRLHQAGAG